MEENEMDRVKQRYTELANALGELSGLLDSLKKTIHKIEGFAAIIDLQIDALNPKARRQRHGVSARHFRNCGTVIG